ncbi:hypothetical protein LCGC14_1858420 [marine sediment metagenome]|uniref:Uncharacterized protein n=1 Tax=marine sediment metagenome TaxID=412755 RepID=A0A0F9J7A2_9ZZZZ
MGNKLEEAKRLEEDYRSGCHRFYQRFDHAQALGFQWGYHPPSKREDTNYMMIQRSPLEEATKIGDLENE